MRVAVISDVHTDITHNGYEPPLDVDADLVVVAGDAMAPATLALPWLRKAFGPDLPIIYVLGNHDFYSDHRSADTKTTWEWQREHAPRVAAENGITLLDDQAVVIEGVRFIGATLWTDFSARPPYVSFDDAVRSAAKAMNDYKLIKTGRGRSKDTLRPRDTVNAHKISRAYIKRTLEEPTECAETVVITHHAPSYRSLLNKGLSFTDLDWCYASNLETLMQGPNAPSLWIHGHIHRNQDYVVGNTRVIANPRGYPTRFVPNAPRENPDFDPHLAIEVGVDLTPAMRI
ncbi:metallophosphoesterase family protein [Tardiphaga sp. 813_E8_N1_3]|uniref:metallophosphoesterase family protein n=1 Tax=Tardiphaga sp. 813_E8_N1_3 TaxID=3240760 RepID=UPI003F1FCE41